MGRPIAGTVDVAEPELNFRIGSGFLFLTKLSFEAFEANDD